MPRPAVQGVVVSYSRMSGEYPGSHDAVTRNAIAERLAALKGYEYGGEFDETARYDGTLYFVPGGTLSVETAEALGIRSEADLFGGVVPFPFVATKTITHPLISNDAARPHGWSEEYARTVRDAVLPGYSAFSIADAQAAGERLLEQGPVRVKPALAIGGRGQTVAESGRALAAALAELDLDALAACGVVIEQNLEDVVTFSVGQVSVGGLEATYVGQQKLARALDGVEVYGGSNLLVARGGFEALLALDLDRTTRRAIEQSRVYDEAAGKCFPGFFASRRNYDIARGRGPDGRMICGVLEQSWRLGGASNAEVAALEAFRGDAALHAVRSECTEVYGKDALPPAGATIYYRDEDAKVGFITKYTTLEPYVDA